MSENPPSPLQEDSIVAAVIAKFAERSALGRKKYGVTLDRTDLNTRDWIRHTQEELMDAILYLERLHRDFEKVASQVALPPQT
jgi:hypothetical protein